jgi:hypothetical protein
LKVIEARTLSIKNGLRNIGILPRKKDWKEFYRPRKNREVPNEDEIELITRKKYPDFYYDYRYLKGVMFGLPGVHDFGLNINFVLSPKDQ